MQKSKRIPIDINESLYEAPIITNLNEQDRPDAGRELKQEVVVYDEKKNEYKSKIKASLKYKKGVKKKAQVRSINSLVFNSHETCFNDLLPFFSCRTIPKIM
jgi:hypothetical protein